MANDNCGGSGGNTGWNNCQELFDDANGFAFMRPVANNGTRNGYDITDGTAIVGISASIYNNEPSERLYPVGGLVSTAAPDEGTQWDTASGGQRRFLRDGIDGFTGERSFAGTAYAANIQQHRKLDNAALMSTSKGLVGIRVLDTSDNTAMWYPFPIDALDANPMKRDLSAGSIEKVMVGFDYSARINIAEFHTIPWSQLDITEDEFVRAGFKDATFATVTAPSAAAGVTTVVYALESDFRSGTGVAQDVAGLSTADFSVTNLSTGLAVANLATTELDDVSYTIVYDQETAGEKISISLIGSVTQKYVGSATTYEEPA